MIRIALCCGSGVATSAAVKKRIVAELNKRGHEGNYEIFQCKVTEAVTKSHQYDCIVTMVSSPLLKQGCKCPIIIGTGLLMNRETDVIYQKIEEIMLSK